MEKNIEVKILETYNDLVLKKIVEAGRKMWVDEKRVKELDKEHLIKLIQIKKK